MSSVISYRAAIISAYSQTICKAGLRIILTNNDQQRALQYKTNDEVFCTVDKRGNTPHTDVSICIVSTL